MMSGNHTEEQVAEFRGVFDFFSEGNNQNGDGTIGKNQVIVVMRALGQNPTEQEVKFLMEIIDRDNDPPINFPYFLSLLAAKMHKQNDEEQLINAFNVFDKDENGQITTEDFRSII